MVLSGSKSNSSKILWIVLVTCKHEEEPTKNKVAIDRDYIFPIISLWELIFRHSSASNSKANIPIWPKFELRANCMSVLITSKVDEDPMKTEGTIDRTRSNMGFFALKGR